LSDLILGHHIGNNLRLVYHITIILQDKYQIGTNFTVDVVLIYFDPTTVRKSPNRSSLIGDVALTQLFKDHIYFLHFLR